MSKQPTAQKTKINRQLAHAVDAGNHETALQGLQVVRFLGAREIERRVGLSRWTIWRMEKEGTFKKSIKIGSKRLWIESEVEEWMAARIAERG